MQAFQIDSNHKLTSSFLSVVFSKEYLSISCPALITVHGHRKYCSLLDQLLTNVFTFSDMKNYYSMSEVTLRPENRNLMGIVLLLHLYQYLLILTSPKEVKKEANKLEETDRKRYGNMVRDTLK